MQHIHFCLLVTLLLAVPVRAQNNEVSTRLHEIFEALSRERKLWAEQTFPDRTLGHLGLVQAFYDSLLMEIDALPYQQLQEDDQIHYEVFRYQLHNDREQLRLGLHLIPFNAEGGFYNQLGFSANRIRDDLESLQRYYDQLQAYPAFFRANVMLMQEGIRRGIIAPRVIAENYLPLMAPLEHTDPDSNLLFRCCLIADDTSADRVSLTREIWQIIADTLLPLFGGFHNFMQTEYLPLCYEAPGIWQVPGGAAIYAQRVAYFTSLDISADSVYELGLQEVDRIRAEMDEVIDQIGFEGSYEAFLQLLRTEPRFYASSPRELLMLASYYAKKADGALPRYFKLLPRLSYGVSPVPEAIAPTYTSGRYAPGSYADGRAGQYWVNTYRLESRPLYALPALTLHEAMPGHHLQIALAQEMEGQPDFRKQSYISAFGEGWALYTEWLGIEMGIYETPYEHFGRLTYEMWRACRLVVDVGMHAKGWLRQQALDFLSSHTALSLHECHTEIDRYIGWPGQALSYKMGEITIRRLRTQAERILGDQFDIKDFHHEILRHGAIPLTTLERLINLWMEGKRME